MPLSLAAFVADDADLDHMTPILHKFVEREGASRLILVIADYERSYRDDYRVKHLATLGVAVHHAVDDLTSNRWLQQRYFAGITSRRRVMRRLAFAMRRVLGRGRLFGSRAYADRFFDREPGRSLSVIIHNHDDAAMIVLSDCARRRGIASVAVPHHADNFDNFMTRAPARVYPVPPVSLHSRADRVIVPSPMSRDRLVTIDVATAAQVRVLGSARFCAEWQEVLGRIVPPVSTAAPPGDFKILVLLAKPYSNYFEAEVLRIIDTIRRLPRVFIAVKQHSRLAISGRAQAPNVQFFDRETSTRGLIGWADLTLFSATSAILDNVMLDRPVLFLRRTLHNKIAAERFVQSWAIDCRDDLCESIGRLRDGTQQRTYSVDERAALIRNLVEPAGPDVLKLYVDEIISATRVATQDASAHKS